MPIPAAEQRFNKGLAALADARPLQAIDCFLDAMHTERRHRVRRPDMRYLSYYGLSLARGNRATREGRRSASPRASAAPPGFRRSRR